jgi:hypothetical protein
VLTLCLGEIIHCAGQGALPSLIKEYLVAGIVNEEYDLLTREGVLTLDKIMMTPNMRTGCANASRVGMILARAA